MSAPLAKDIVPPLPIVLRLAPFSLILSVGISLYTGLCLWTLILGIASGILITPVVLAHLREPRSQRIIWIIFASLFLGIHILLLRIRLHPLTDAKAWLFLIAQLTLYLSTLFTAHALTLLLHRQISRHRSPQPVPSSE